MQIASTGLQPAPLLRNCIAAQPGSSLLAIILSGHQVALAQMMEGHDVPPVSERSGTAAVARSDNDAYSLPGSLRAVILLRLAFGARNHVCCAAWDASGSWLAVGSVQQLHLFQYHADRRDLVPMGSTQLRFTPKV
jgi:hypothetical protein